MSSVEFNYLSRLPDSMLSRILSFLPAHDATRMVLLRTFNDLWTNIDRLDFDDHYFVAGQNTNVNRAIGTLKFIRFVRNFLMLHQCSKIRKFRLSFTFMFVFEFEGVAGIEMFDERDKGKFMNEVEMWIKYPYTRGVEEIDMQFGAWTSRNKFKIPEFVWTSDSLTELRLFNCEVVYPKKAWMGLLRIMTLNSVSISSEALSKLVGCCSLLQDLRITDCNRLTKLSFIAPNIKNLIVYMDKCKWKVTVNCPSVRSFDFTGYVDSVEIVNLSLLEKVTFTLRLDYSFKFNADLQFKRFMDKIQHADILVLDKVAFSVLTYRALQNHPCPRNKWKCIVLHTWLSKSFIKALCSMLRYSTSLEKLIIHMEDRTEYSFQGPRCLVEIILLQGVELVNEPEGDDYKHFEDDDWSFPCLKQCLKNVTMHGLLSSSCNAQLDLARIILKNGLVLDKLTIFGQGITTQSVQDNWLTRDNLLQLSHKLQAFPRASDHTSVYLQYPLVITTVTSRPMSPVSTEIVQVETKSKRKQRNSKRRIVVTPPIARPPEHQLAPSIDQHHRIIFLH